MTAESEALPVDVHVLEVTPHMHNLGGEIKVTAVVPDVSEEVPLIWIRDWDFNWQGNYQFEKPIDLPKGSKIKVQSIYDNSADNPKNPNSPPKAVRWGEQTTDEMCLCGVQVITDKPSDLIQIASMAGSSPWAGLAGGVPEVSDAAKKSGRHGQDADSEKIGNFQEEASREEGRGQRQRHGGRYGRQCSGGRRYCR